MVKIATWNVCLGLKNKKTYVSNTIEDNKIDICCIQECEIEKNYPSQILTFKNFHLEIENNTIKSRCCTYIRGGLPYVRRDDLEGVDNNLVIVEATFKTKKFLIINIYRTFSQQGGVTPETRFGIQIDIIKNAIINNKSCTPIVLGDFNLNFSLNHNITYQYKRLFDTLNVAVMDCGLTQIVNFPTWHRNINGIDKESTLDHIYIEDTTKIESLTDVTPEIGDHKLIILELSESAIIPKKVLKRNWKNYST